MATNRKVTKGEMCTMATQAIKRTCPVCRGTGKPTGDKSVGEIILGTCYKCGGSGEVTDYVEIPSGGTPGRSSSSSGSDDVATGLVGLVLVIAVFVLVFAIILAYVILSALVKVLSTEKGQRDFTKFLAVVALILLGWLIAVYALSPYALSSYLPSLLPYPQSAFFLYFEVIPVMLVFWGSKHKGWLSATWNTIISYFRFFFESASQSFEAAKGLIP